MSLHEQFDELGKLHTTPLISTAHTQSDAIIRECREILYNLPTGRPLINFLNLHRIPVAVHVGPVTGYSIPHDNMIVLTCPVLDKPPYYEISIYLAQALRHAEIHLPRFQSPEMKDSREWSNVLISETFDLMMTACKIIYDMKTVMQNDEIDHFIKANDYNDIYEAFEKKLPFSEIEDLMFKSISRRNSKTDS